MDWFSWLSKASLDPSLIYQYGLAFARNELEKDDLIYFNHEFLNSMGITVAKHRLEILKLARKEVGYSTTAAPNYSLSKLLLAINKTKKCFAMFFSNCVFSAIKPSSEPVLVRYREQWRGALMSKKYNEKELEMEKAVVKTRRIAKSGPLEYGREQERKLMITNRSLKLSGPLDRNVQERLVNTYRSPVLSGPLDGRVHHERFMFTNNNSPKRSGPLNVRPPSPRVYTDYSKEKLSGGSGADQTLWAALFQDMKPT